MSTRICWDVKTPQGHFVEIEYLNVPKSAPKSQRFQWYWNDQPLTVRDVRDGIRYFTNGLTLDLSTVGT